MTTGLFLLRCAELGISMADLDLLTVGMITEMMIEKGLDGKKMPVYASQHDFDVF